MILRGRLVLDDRIQPGRLSVEDGHITAIEPDPTATGPFVVPGFADLHVHGWGGHAAMGGPESLDGMARALLRHGVTSFLPTGWTAPLTTLAAFAEGVREWMSAAPTDGAAPMGFNLEGPFLSLERRGAHDPRHLREPADVSPDELAPLLNGLRLITIAPELPGALSLIESLHERGVVISLGHSSADLNTAMAGYRAGAASTTHLFNAMSGATHRDPGLAIAALTDDGVGVELIADGEHVHPALWPIIWRTKPRNRLLLVSDALSLAGTADGRTMLGGVEILVEGLRATLAGTTTLAGSVIALDTAVRNMVLSGLELPAAVAAASSSPLSLLGITDRGRLAVGQLADLVELDDDLRVQRVLHGGRWNSAVV